MQQPAERFDDVVREYIDLVNHQVGVYMDALAGFAGHYTRVERQVHRVLGPQGRADPKARERVVVWASYEDPARPDVIDNRIVRADDYLAINARGGGNEQQHAQSVLVFLFTFWESEIRPRLATAASVPLDGIRSNIMGDLRLLRHAILHSKGVLRPDKHRGLTELAAMFLPDQPIRPSYDDMHRIRAHQARLRSNDARMAQGFARSRWPSYAPGCRNSTHSPLNGEAPCGMCPNPFIERTVTGKPVPAAHVKR